MGVDLPDWEGGGGKDVNVLVEYIELDLLTARSLIREHLDAADHTALFKEVEGMISTGEAKPVETMWVRVAKQQRATSHSVDQIIYPTEADPPEIPNSVKLDNVGEVSRLQGTPANMTAFETRDVGSRIEVLAGRDSESEWIPITLAPGLEVYQGDRHLIADEYRLPELDTIMMPRFYALTVGGSRTQKSGAYYLLGLLRPAGQSDRRLMVFARADEAQGPDLPAKQDQKADAAGGEETSRGPSSLLVTVDWIEADYPRVRKLLHTEMGRGSHARAHEEVEAWMEAEDATLLESMTLVLGEFAKTTIASSDEHVYATEFDPAEVPNEIDIRNTPFDGRLEGTPGNPTAFDVRELGPELTVEPRMLDDLKGISLDINVEMDEFVRDKPIMTLDEGEENAKLVGSGAMPIFYDLRTSTTVHPPLSQPFLLAVHTPREKPGRRILLFMTVSLPGWK